MMISKYTISIIDESIKELNAMKTDMEKKLSLAYRRTTTVINRYN
jgi:prefoldin subunit 5